MIVGVLLLAAYAFAVDRVLRRFGLCGLSFIPLLSAHACALPGIMSARLIRDDRDRLATILVAPFMSCSARLPVYVLLIGILAAGKPDGTYAHGIIIRDGVLVVPKGVVVPDGFVF